MFGWGERECKISAVLIKICYTCMETLNAYLRSGRVRVASQLRKARRRRRRRRSAESSKSSFEADNARELAALACLTEMRYRDSKRAAIAARRRMRARRLQRQLVVVSSTCSSTSGPESFAEVLQELFGWM